MCIGRLEQTVQDEDLVGTQFPVDHVRDHVEIHTLFGEPGSGFEIVRRGGGKGEIARILVDAEAQNGGFVRREGHALFLENQRKDGRGRAPGPDIVDISMHVFRGIRMMIGDVNFQTGIVQYGGHMGDAILLAGVHQDQTFDRSEIDLLGRLEIEQIGGALDKKILEVAFLGSRKDENCVFIEFAGRNYGAQRVEIRVGMGCDNGMGCLFGHDEDDRGWCFV